jgi:hypothetical protein
MLKILCDKCRTRLAAGETTLKVRTGPMRASHAEIHLCQDHGEELMTWLLDRVSVPKAPKPEPMVVRPRPTVVRNGRRSRP